MANTKLTPSVHKRLTAALSAGCFRIVAAEAAGIHRSTLYSWLERGEADHDAGKRTAHASLYAAVLAAEANAEIAAVETIRDAAPDDWRAASWFLEHRYQDRWGGKTVVEHTGKVQHDLTGLSDAELTELERELDRRAAL